MAEEKKQPEEKKQTTKGETDEPQEAGKKKSKTKLILFLVLIVIFLGGGGAGYFLFSSKIKTFSNTIMQKYFGKKPPEGEQEGGEQKEAKEHKKKEVVGPILALEPFVFNMSGNQAKYAKVTLGVELKDPKVMEEAKKMVPVIRDKILSILGAKAPEALMDVNQRNTIKSEVQASLKTLFKDEEELRAVYITDIIIQ
jgi:flagellar FliL protein